MLNITKNILLLSKSIRIKFNLYARYTNEILDINHDSAVSNTDITELKYYMNLCGIKHHTNNDVKIKIIETGENISLSIKSLEENRYTRNELLKNGSMYDELLDTYPEDVDYIIGCLYPTDMETIRKAKDGDVLVYNPAYIEDNENIIESLESFIKNVMDRWLVKSYVITDDAFIIAFMGVLYSNIPGAINNIRLDNIKTNRVNSYYLEQYFNSSHYLWKDVKYLNKESIYWLYNNLDYIMKHIGKNKALFKLVDNVFEKNNVGIGSYNLKQSLPEVTDNGMSYLPFDTDRNLIVTKGLNKSYTSSEDKTLSIETITELQLVESDPLQGLIDNQSEKSEYISANIIEDLKNNNTNIEKTKILDIFVKDMYMIDSDSLLDTTINHLIYLVANNLYTGLVDYSDPNSNNTTSKPKLGSTIEYTEPNSTQSYTLTPYTGVLMLIALLMKLSGKEDTPLTHITYHKILSNGHDVEELLENMFPDEYSDKLIRHLESIRPVTNEKMQTPLDMSEYINRITDFNKVTWILDSNSGNTMISTNIKHYLEKTTFNGKLVLSDEPKTIDELLKEHGITYTIKNSYDLVASIRNLLYGFTMTKVDEYEELRLSMIAYKNIIDKLTSYTTQVINNIDNVDNTVMLYDNMPTPLYSKKGVLKVLETEFKPLEDFIGVLKTEINDFRDNAIATIFSIDRPKVIARREPVIDGYCCMNSNSWIRDDRPVNIIEIADVDDYNIIDDEFVDVFFKKVKIEHNPMEDMPGGNSTEINDFRDTTNVKLNDSVNSTVYDKKIITGVTGKAFLTHGSGVIKDRPNNIIEILD